jgi:hypothetical protein
LLAFFSYASQTYATIQDGLITWYPFDGDAIDATGNGNDALIFGASITEDRFGNPNGAFEFDGLDDWMDIGPNIKPPFPITVSSWIKLDNLDQGLVFRNDQFDNRSYRYGIAIQTSGGRLYSHVFEGFSMPSNRVNKISNEALAAPGDWHHFVVVFNAHNNMQQYWDTKEVEGYYDGTGSGIAYSSGSGAVGMHYTSAGATFFAGCIDDIRIYNRALSEQEIHELHEIPEPSTIMIFSIGSLISLLRRKAI